MKDKRKNKAHRTKIATFFFAMASMLFESWVWVGGWGWVGGGGEGGITHAQTLNWAVSH